MKRILITVLFLSVYAGAMAADRGPGEIDFDPGIHGRFEFGYDTLNHHYRTDWRLGVDFTLFIDHRIYGGQTCLFIRDGINGKPFRDIYTIGYKAQYRIFYFRAEHYCSHAVVSGDGTHYLYRDRFGNSTIFSAGVQW